MGVEAGRSGGGLSYGYLHDLAEKTRRGLYAGRLVWNRQRYVKDPDTGKRVSRTNPADAWIITDVPHGFILSSHDLLTCFNARSRRTPTNRRSIRRHDVETRVLRAMRERTISVPNRGRRS